MGKQEIIARISYFRTKAKLSQKALSLNIGMNFGYINRLESKRDFMPSVDVLLKIIEVCQISEEEFFYDDYLHYATDKVIIEKLKALPAEKKDALLKLI